MSIRLLFAAGSLLVASVYSLGCRPSTVGTEARFERTLVVEGPVTLEIATGAGSIAIARGADGRVEFAGRIRAGDFAGGDAAARIRRIAQSPPIEHDGGRILVGRTGDDPLYRDLTLSYEVRVPARTAVVSRSGSGSQTVVNLAGPVDVQGASGALVLTRILGDVRASTGSGSIRIDDAGADLIVHSGSGSITAHQLGGAVEARTSSGSIRLGGRPGRDWKVASASGSVRLALASDAAFALDARTASGSITTTHALDAADAGARVLRGVVGRGGPSVEVTTASGSIRVE